MMSPDPREDDLAAEFAKLRDADGGKVPRFEAMWRPRPKRLSPWWIAAPAAAVPVLAAAAAVILWVARPQNEAAPAAGAVAPAALQAMVLDPEPLDFLLDSPSLGATPDFDTNPVATNR
jgi:hypothetical protein